MNWLAFQRLRPYKKLPTSFPKSQPMQSYTVYESPRPAADRIDRAEQLLFVREGFSWGAALFAPLWLLVHRLWWACLGYVGLVLALYAVGSVLRIEQSWIGLACIGLNLLLGFEADALRRWALERRGWTNAGAISGSSLSDCERRFFEAWLPGQPILAPVPDASGGLAAGLKRGWGLGGLLGSR